MLYQSPRLREYHRFATYARQRDPTELYNFASASRCAVCQFLGTHASKWDEVTEFADDLNIIARPLLPYQSPIDTWGNLVKRIERHIEAWEVM
jgi:hypothetical protein